MKVGHIRGNLKLTSTPKQIGMAVANGITGELNTRIRRRLNKVEVQIQELIRQAILDNAEIRALCSNDRLVGELGVPNLEAVWAEIAAIVSKTATIVFRPFRATKQGAVSGSITLYAVPVDTSYLTSLGLASIQLDDGTWEWLYHLLNSGDSIIVQGMYSDKLDPRIYASSRTGQGLMLTWKSKSWRVPPSVSGTEASNVITRAVLTFDMRAKIEALLQSLIL